MGRKKTYDRDTLIARSVELFRDHGYQGTSTQMLVDGLEINRYSLYAEFGDKQTLFDAALARYNEAVIEPRFAPLEDPDAGLEQIRDVVEFYGSDGQRRGTGRGCLLCNTAVEYGAHDPSGAGFVPQYLARLSRAFRTALDNAHRRGELRATVDPHDEAELLTATVLGMFVMLRASAPATTIHAAARAAIDHLDTLRAPDPG
jgi:TetR/AcrR family transcriptional repressor of nem operon